MKIRLLVTFMLIYNIVNCQNNIFSLSYSNQFGLNQFNSIQNDFHNNDRMFSGYSYKNFGINFERKLNTSRQLWINFSLNIWEEEYKFDYYYLFSNPSQDPFNYLTEEDFTNLSPRQKSKSFLQTIDLELSLKKVFQTKLWGLEIVPELGLYTRTDFGLVDGFQYGSIIQKDEYYYSNVTRFRTNNSENNNNVFGFCSLNINKLFYNKLQLGLDISYFPRIKMDYDVSTVVNIYGADSNGSITVYYFEEINDFTEVQLVYDLFRFGFHLGYKF